MLSNSASRSSTSTMGNTCYFAASSSSSSSSPVTPTFIDIQLVSDIHLEINVDNDILTNPTSQQREEMRKRMLDQRYCPQLIPKAPYLALLGDTGWPDTWIFREYLLHLAEQFKKVFIVTGNHEFYSWSEKKRGMVIRTSLAKAPQTIRTLCLEHPDIFVFLDRQSVRVSGCTCGAKPDDSAHTHTPQCAQTADFNLNQHGGLRVCGTTLWRNTACPGSNDTRLIYKVDGKHIVRESDIFEMNSAELQWIESERERALKLGQSLLVLTHHPPMNEEHLKCGVSAWLHGHTHESSLTCPNKSGQFLASNQWGYVVHNKDHRPFEGYMNDCVYRICTNPAFNRAMTLNLSMVQSETTANQQPANQQVTSQQTEGEKGEHEVEKGSGEEVKGKVEEKKATCEAKAEKQTRRNKDESDIPERTGDGTQNKETAANTKAEIEREGREKEKEAEEMKTEKAGGKETLVEEQKETTKGKGKEKEKEKEETEQKERSKTLIRQNPLLAASPALPDTKTET